MSDEFRGLLRHLVATLAYRGGKVIRGAPEDFGELRVGESVRTPGEILAHVGDLFEWAASMVEGRQRWSSSSPLPWAEEADRFHRTLGRLDEELAHGELDVPVGRLIQGPLADALTHVGQIAFLRRLAGAPIRGENFAKAKIEVGRVGPDQPPPVYEFD